MHSIRQFEKFNTQSKKYPVALKIVNHHAACKRDWEEEKGKETDSRAKMNRHTFKLAPESILTLTMICKTWKDCVISFIDLE